MQTHKTWPWGRFFTRNARKDLKDLNQTKKGDPHSGRLLRAAIDWVSLCGFQKKLPHLVQAWLKGERTHWAKERRTSLYRASQFLWFTCLKLTSSYLLLTKTLRRWVGPRVTSLANEEA